MVWYKVGIPQPTNSWQDLKSVTSWKWSLLLGSGSEHTPQLGWGLKSKTTKTWMLWENSCHHTQVCSFSCMVATWDTTFILKREKARLLEFYMTCTRLQSHWRLELRRRGHYKACSPCVLALIHGYPWVYYCSVMPSAKLWCSMKAH